MTDNALVTCLWFDTEGEAAAKWRTEVKQLAAPGVGPRARGADQGRGEG